MRRASVQHLLGIALPLVLLVVLILLLQAVQFSDVTLQAQQPTLTITKTDSVDPAPSGGILTYTLDIVSTRNQATANVVVTDTLDPNVTLVTSQTTNVSFTCSQSSGSTVVCSLASLAANGQEAVTLSVRIDAGFTGTLTNLATVNSADTDPSDDTETTDVRAVADLGITKAATASQATAGGSLTYVLTATNAGPMNAPAVVVIDTLPGSVAYRSSPTHGNDCSETGSIVTCALNSMAAGSSQRIDLLVDVNTDATGTLVNSAQVSGDVIDENAGNDTTGNVTTPVIAQADVQIGKRGDPDTVAAGGALTYSLSVTNAGPSDALVVVVTDTLPQHVTYDSHQASRGTFDPATGLWSVGTLAPAAPATLSLVVEVQHSFTGIITNWAEVSSDTFDPVTATGNADSAVTSVIFVADLEVVKHDGPDPVVAGTALTYTVMVTNAGPSTATGVVLTDTLPQGVALESHTVSQGTYTPTTGIWDLGQMVPGSSATLLFRTLVDPGARGTLSNQAQVSSHVDDPDPSTNVTTEMTTVAAEADLEIAKSDFPDPVAAGTALTYTVVITNHGPSNATGVRLTDTLPLSITLATATPGQSSGPNPLVWSLGELARGLTETVTVVVTPDPWISTTLTNTVHVAASEQDPGLRPNQDTETTLVKPLCEIVQVTDTPTDVINVWPSIGGLGADTRIAYLSDRTGRDELFVATLSTSVQTQQATSSAAGTTLEMPAISGNGRRVAFVSDGDLDPWKANDDGSAEVFVYDTRFGGFQNVTGNAGSVFPGFVLHPSPDDSGGRLAFSSDYDYTGQNSDSNLEVWLHDSANSPFRQVDGGYGHTCSLRADGTAICWGYDASRQATAPVGPFLQVSAGGFHTCGLRMDGSLLCWGHNGNGQAPGAVAGQYLQVSAGNDHTCAVQSGGDVACWGENSHGEASPPAGGPFQLVSAGQEHTCALLSGGGAYCWGDTTYNQTSPPPGSGPFQSLSAGYYHTCGLQVDGAVVCWGQGLYGQTSVPSGGGTWQQVSAGGYHTCGLRQDGDVQCWGADWYDQITPPPGSGPFSRIGVGDYTSCGVTEDGGLTCWGAGWYGQDLPPESRPHMLQVTDSVQSSSAPVASSGNGRFVAFLSNGDLDEHGGNVDGSVELFVASLETDPYQIVQVTHTPPSVAISQLSIGYDGRRIAFLSDGDLVPAMGNPEGNPEVFVAEWNPANPSSNITLTQITDTGSGVTQAAPVLSGDGRTVAFISDGALDPQRTNADANPELYVAAVDTPGTFTQVTLSGPDVANSAPSINRLGTQIAFVSDGNFRPAPGNPEGNQEIFAASCRFPVPVTELSIDKAGPLSAWNGGTYPYSLLVSNEGQAPAYGVAVNDHLAGAASLYAGDPRCEEQGPGEVSCYASELGAGDTTTFTVWARVETSSGQLVYTADVQAVNTQTAASNQLTITIGPAADLSVEKSTSASWVAQGEAISYTMVIANDPLGLATSVTVTDTLSTRLPYVAGSASFTGGSCGSWQGGALVCTHPSLAAGGTATLTLTITPQQSGVITNTVRVAGAIQDPNLANNEDTVVLGPPPIYLPIILRGG